MAQQVNSLHEVRSDVSTPTPLASPMSLSQIDDYAENFYEQHRLGYAVNNLYIDMNKIIHLYGGRIESPTLDEFGETMEVRATGDFTIFLPYFTSDRRDRFTLAHELGHYFLHYPWSDDKAPRMIFNRPTPTRVTRRSFQDIETQANRFAAALLMPKKRFIETLADNSKNLEEAARAWNVSREAARVRLETLKIGFVDA